MLRGEIKLRASEVCRASATTGGVFNCSLPPHLFVGLFREAERAREGVVRDIFHHFGRQLQLAALWMKPRVATSEDPNHRVPGMHREREGGGWVAFHREGILEKNE